MDTRNKHWILYRIKSRSVEQADGCIIWQGVKNKRGYGQIVVTLETGKSKTMYAHRALWMAHHDVELGSKIYVCHKCDNPSCVNIKHLFFGTAKVNQQDMASKGRSIKGRSRPYDYSNPRNKPKLHTRIKRFTNEEIIAIRNATGKLKHIAWQFKTTVGYVSKLKNGIAKTLV